MRPFRWTGFHELRRIPDDVANVELVLQHLADRGRTTLTADSIVQFVGLAIQGLAVTCSEGGSGQGTA